MRSLAACLLSLCLPACAAPGGLPPGAREAIAARTAAYREAHRVPGVSVAVGTPDDLATAVAGWADVAAERPIAATTRFRLASISKTITAVMLMQAVAAGRVDLDADVRRYVPSFPAKPWPFTVRQLGGHLAGIRHYAAGDAARQHPCERIADGLDIFRDDPLVAEPGTKYSYTTYGFNLLGCVAEAGLEAEYVAWCRERIFEPAGAASFAVWKPGLDDDARGYRLVDGVWTLHDPTDTTYKIPGGGWCASAEDVCRFALATAAGRLVPEPHLSEMWTGQSTRDGKSTGYGIGWSTRTRDGRLEVSHSGGQEGCATMLFCRPSDGVAAVVLTNLAGAPGLGDLARELAEIAAPVAPPAA